MRLEDFYSEKDKLEIQLKNEHALLFAATRTIESYMLDAYYSGRNFEFKTHQKAFHEMQKVLDRAGLLKEYNEFRGNLTEFMMALHGIKNLDDLDDIEEYDWTV